MRYCSSPDSESSENAPGIKAHSVVQGRASKVPEQAERGCEEFGINTHTKELVIIQIIYDTCLNASVDARCYCVLKRTIPKPKACAINPNEAPRPSQSYCCILALRAINTIVCAFVHKLLFFSNFELGICFLSKPRLTHKTMFEHMVSYSRLEL